MASGWETPGGGQPGGTTPGGCTRLVEKAVCFAYTPRMWRGFREYEGSAMLWDEPVENLVGLEVTDEGFVSTSTARKVSEGFAHIGSGSSERKALFHVRVPAGTHGITPYNFSGGTAGSDYENELILSRGSTFRISKAVDMNGYRLFYVDYLPPKGPRKLKV